MVNSSYGSFSVKLLLMREGTDAKDSPDKNIYKCGQHDKQQSEREMKKINLVSTVTMITSRYIRFIIHFEQK